ncbi:uncharacterized protein LOC123682136 [Harmonia axyridis]|uniref:uncharacterized protein LOC123682136 n=1 Tax=Harmonia axyridis TaxID=115357 RepID=UPI001E2790D6|nr:uncharacterized protein LOC123682136 [Harmonia axyridis]XP_045476524.1 uncharacterized protein LOC123682136 [Harmonia axyridis]
MTVMASFRANPNDENEPWLEMAALEGYGFRVWHIMVFAVTGFFSFLVFLAFCIRIRIPRTKQEIEADYHRKKLAEKFIERLRLIENQEMDTLDLKRALDIIQKDYLENQENINFKYGILTTQSSDNSGRELNQNDLSTSPRT